MDALTFQSHHSNKRNAALPRALGSLAVVQAGLSTASAAMLTFTLTFNSIPLDFNGSTDVASGNVTIVVNVDDSTADSEPNANFGAFVADSAFITAPTLGLNNVAFTTPVAIFLSSDLDSIGLSLGGTGNFATRTGFWNFQAFDAEFGLTDPNDLSTFSAPYTGVDVAAESNLQFLTTFGGSPNVVLANGSFFDGGQNSSPGVGNVVIGATVVEAVVVNPSPEITAYTQTGATASLDFTGTDGQSYKLIRSTSIGFSPSNVVDTVTLSGSSGSLEDASSTANSVFYRIDE